MRIPSMILALLAGCGAESSAPDSTTTDASVSLCPYAMASGVARAIYFEGSGCAYVCIVGFQFCGTQCFAWEDRDNCGRCGNVCPFGTRCIRPPTAPHFGPSCQ